VIIVVNTTSNKSDDIFPIRDALSGGAELLIFAEKRKTPFSF
jgi:hypothetical protein